MKLTNVTYLEAKIKDIKLLIETLNQLDQTKTLYISSVILQARLDLSYAEQDLRNELLIEANKGA